MPLIDADTQWFVAAVLPHTAAGELARNQQRKPVR